MTDLKVAIVDDHELVRNGIMGIVNGFEGYKVCLQARHGKDFIEQVQRGIIPDIVLLDITMPVMDGYETSAWIKEHLKSAKTLVLSMLDDETAVIRMLKNGVAGYIVKDSRPVNLLNGLNAIRDSGFFLNEKVNIRMIQSLEEHPSLLNKKELEFLRLAASELTYKEIADIMKASPRTIDGYRDILFEKLDVRSRVGLVLTGIKQGLISI